MSTKHPDKQTKFELRFKKCVKDIPLLFECQEF